MDPSITQRLSRRRFLAESALAAGAAVGAPLVGGGLPAAAAPPPPATLARGPKKVAAIITEYRPRSHADVICGRLIEGYRLDVSPHPPPVSVRAMYIDQLPASDLGKALSKHYRVPITKTVRDAILDERGKLAVDGVLLIGEHGDYPYNERGQHLYPRRRFFEETVAAFEEAGTVAPLFNDKHLSALWEDAEFMYQKARELEVPFLAGSSLPLAWRRPWLELPLEAPVEETVAVAYGGIESYGFHGLETLQCMVERRAGGESGVRAVECLEGEAVWQAMRAGRFSRELAEEALSRHDPPVTGDITSRCDRPAAFLIDYRDGLRAALLLLNGCARQFLFAARLRGFARPVSTLFWLQEPGFGHFSYLANAIAGMVLDGKPPYPVERTLLATGILAAAMDSRFEGHRRVETPWLEIAYRTTDHELAAHRHPDAADTRHGGWIDLLAGDGLDGWVAAEAPDAPRWEKREGLLVGSGGRGFLSTLEGFEDLELFCEMKVDGGSREKAGAGASIFVRSPILEREEDGSPRGYEVRCHPRGPAGSIGGFDAARAREAGGDMEEGAWFTLRVLAAGERLSTRVNGEPVFDGRDPERRFRSGAIAIHLGDPRCAVSIRELRVRGL